MYRNGFKYRAKDSLGHKLEKPSGEFQREI